MANLARFGLTVPGSLVNETHRDWQPANGLPLLEPAHQKAIYLALEPFLALGMKLV